VKLLLTSSGIANSSIKAELERLLGKPISQSSALIVPTGIYPFSVGGVNAYQLITGQRKTAFVDAGWKSVGILELTALTSIRPEAWVPLVEDADALLVWGGNVMYLNYWMRRSGLANMYPHLNKLVYVGVSAGSIVLTPFNCDAEFNLGVAPDGHEMRDLGTSALGLVDFALCVHYDNPDPIFEDHRMEKVLPWASELPYPTYLIDDETAISVVDGQVAVISEGHWDRIEGAANYA
jgi:dipeptidase E